MKRTVPPTKLSRRCSDRDFAQHMAAANEAELHTLGLDIGGFGDLFWSYLVLIPPAVPPTMLLRGSSRQRDGGV